MRIVEFVRTKLVDAWEASVCETVTIFPHALLRVTADVEPPTWVAVVLVIVTDWKDWGYVVSMRISLPDLRRPVLAVMSAEPPEKLENMRLLVPTTSDPVGLVHRKPTLPLVVPWSTKRAQVPAFVPEDLGGPLWGCLR